MKRLMEEIEKWSSIYEFSFQFWGEGQNNVYINKSSIEVASFGGENTIEDILKKALAWVNKQNPKGYKAPVIEIHRCQGCGTRVARANDFCGECMCEDDCEY